VSRGFGNINWREREKKKVAAGKKKTKHSVSKCKICASHKKHSATRYNCKLRVVGLHRGSCLEEYHCEALLDHL
jgi:hypothetical protein